MNDRIGAHGDESWRERVRETLSHCPKMLGPAEADIALAALNVLVQRLAAAEQEGNSEDMDEALDAWQKWMRRALELERERDEAQARAEAAERDNERLREELAEERGGIARTAKDAGQIIKRTRERAERAEARVTELERALEQ